MTRISQIAHNERINFESQVVFKEAVKVITGFLECKERNATFGSICLKWFSK